MKSKSASGDADLLTQKRDLWYWRRIERTANTIVDTSLANRSVCRGAAARADAASPYAGYVGANARKGDHAPQWSDET